MNNYSISYFLAFISIVALIIYSPLSVKGQISELDLTRKMSYSIPTSIVVNASSAGGDKFKFLIVKNSRSKSEVDFSGELITTVFPDVVSIVTPKQYTQDPNVKRLFAKYANSSLGFSVKYVAKTKGFNRDLIWIVYSFEYPNSKRVVNGTLLFEKKIDEAIIIDYINSPNWEFSNFLSGTDWECLQSAIRNQRFIGKNSMILAREMYRNRFNNLLLNKPCKE